MQRFILLLKIRKKILIVSDFLVLTVVEAGVLDVRHFGGEVV